MKLRFLCMIMWSMTVGLGNLFSQPQQKLLPQSVSATMLFDDIQRGVAVGDISTFAKHFAKQVYVDLPGEEGGYFSENQLFYILQNFFGSRLTQQFKFTTMDETETGPYATGSGNFMYRGHREVLQIYVALSKLDDRWAITQFNVY